MTHVKRVTPIVKLNLRLQCESIVYAIAAAAPNNTGKKVTLKNCAPFIVHKNIMLKTFLQ